MLSGAAVDIVDSVLISLPSEQPGRGDTMFWCLQLIRSLEKEKSINTEPSRF